MITIKVLVTPPPEVKVMVQAPVAFKLLKVGSVINNYNVTGAVNSSTETAGETISSGKVVYLLSNRVYNFDPGDVSIYYGTVVYYLVPLAQVTVAATPFGNGMKVTIT